jgi:succinyl-CoA synthetase beta subunit
MNIHEYQARELLKAYGVPVPAGKMARTPQEAQAIAQEIGGPVVVKAQVHVGGRGKAGGVKLAKTPAEAASAAGKILGMSIKGLVVRKVLVSQAVEIEKEFYLGMVLDRAAQRPLVMVSSEGGVDIEEVAAKHPERIVKRTIDPLVGLNDYEGRNLAFRLLKNVGQVRKTAEVLQKLYRLFMEGDCSLVEVNPFILTKQGELWAIDAKVSLDENAFFRHPSYEGLRDPDAEHPDERKARDAGLSYVPLDGSIGCLVNGAGLAMATMDAVKLAGGDPANFLDVGGSSDPKKVVTALEIITANRKVKAILFNIFGGITRCDDVAQGILQAFKQMTISLPVVVRLTGTNEREARELLRGTKLVPAETMDEAVRKVVELAA